MVKSNQKVINRLKDGRFGKGFVANPSGKNGFNTVSVLVEALKKDGLKHKQPFWDYVAQRARTNDGVLITLIKKLLPDKIQGEGLANGVFVYVIRDAKTSGDRIDIPAALKSAEDSK